MTGMVRADVEDYMGGAELARGACIASFSILGDKTCQHMPLQCTRPPCTPYLVTPSAPCRCTHLEFGCP